MYPNFFIVGAPKCGTTSLATWLDEHSQIFMSPRKEPYFYSSDIKNPNAVRSRAAYERLFKDAERKHLAVGEASTDYMYSRIAIPQILKEIPNAKFIVSLRNPVDMAYSLYRQRVKSGDENLKNFREAWDLLDKRKEGCALPPFTSSADLLLYDLTCMLGEQLERLYDNAPKDQILVILLEDIKSNPRKCYENILNFLEVPDDGRLCFPVLNSAVEPKFWVLSEIIGIGNRVKDRLGLPPLNKTLSQWIINAITKESERKTMDPNMREELLAHFEPEICRVESLLGRDLSGWRT